MRSYWRLTSLEEFDGRIWSSSGSFGSADGDSPSRWRPTWPASSFEQSFTISSLAAIWLPSAYEPRALDVDGADVRYDEESATLIVDNDVTTSDGLTYQVSSRLAPHHAGGPRRAPPTRSPATSAIASSSCPRASAPRCEPSPRRSPTAPRPPPSRRGRCRTTCARFDLLARRCSAGHSEDALEDFLFANQVGYCEQFAGAFAAMARSIGLPARVAVGFTPGDEDPDEPGHLHRARRVRPRLARGVHRGRRVGALRAHPRPRRAERRGATRACRSSRPRPATPGAS